MPISLTHDIDPGRSLSVYMTGSGTCGPKNEGDRGRGAYILKLEWVCYRLTRCCEHSTGPTTHQTSPMLAERYWLWVSTCFKQPQTPLGGSHFGLGRRAEASKDAPSILLLFHHLRVSDRHYMSHRSFYRGADEWGRITLPGYARMTFAISG